MAKKEVQDNQREEELIKLFRLKKTNFSRIGVDAELKIKSHMFKFEIKSTTTGSITTASPLTLNQIKKWRGCHWIIGIYDEQQVLKYCLYATPDDMKGWLDYWENDIKRGLYISDMFLERIDYKMVRAIFGNKKQYSFDDIYPIFKKLFSKNQYKEFANKNGLYNISTVKKMFIEHNKTYLYRGSNVNNPKINKNYYKNWTVIDKDFDETIRKKLLESI